MINLMNLTASALGFLANILIVRSTGDMHTLDQFYSLIQLALTISGFFSATIVFNLVPKLINSDAFLKQSVGFSQRFYQITVASFLLILLTASTGIKEPTVLALILIQIGLAIDGAIWQALKMLRSAVFFQMAPQIFVVSMIVVLGLPIIVEYTIAMFLAYSTSRFILIRTLNDLGWGRAPKINVDFLKMIQTTTISGVGSFVFSAYPFLDVYYSRQMTPGSLTLLVITQRIMIASANILTYSRFLKAPHEFGETRSYREVLRLIKRNIIFNTLIFSLIFSLVWLGFSPILEVFKITEHAEQFWKTILEIMPGTYFMLQAAFIVRYIKSEKHIIKFDIAMLVSWFASYIGAFYIFADFYNSLAFCYSVAWAVTTIFIIIPNLLIKVNARRTAATPPPH